MNFIPDALTKLPHLYFSKPESHSSNRSSGKLTETARLSITEVLNRLGSTENGLSEAESRERLKKYGRNEVAKEKRHSLFMRLLENFKNPLVLLLLTLGWISYLTGDMRGAIVILIMVFMGVALRYFQEQRADDAAEKLREMVRTTTSVMRDGNLKEITLQEVVPGDVIHLSVGDMVPADVRILTSRDLFLNQSALTGESMPVEKTFQEAGEEFQDSLELPNICFLGSDVESGTGSAVVVSTGADTYFGTLAESIVGQRQLTSFDKGINTFTWLMISFMAVMVPLVFILNLITKRNWLEAFLFALAVAVGLTPEMLPMIVSVNLSKGAMVMAKKKVIVKRLNAIQNFGAMDVLCTDKTGTLTQGKIILVKHMDVQGNESQRILDYAYLNSYFQTGLKNLMDLAVLDFSDLEKVQIENEHFQKVDEIPFDFNRRRMSVIVESHDKRHILICKGATEEVMSLCKFVEIQGEVLERTPEHDAHRAVRVRKFNEDGFRVIALAYKYVSDEDGKIAYSVKDESNMILLGFLAFLDPPKETASLALAQLHQHNVTVKILTGDNQIVAASICRQVGLPVDADAMLIGSEIEIMNDDQLAEAAEKAIVFAKLSPSHKERIIHALQRKEHVVGFMGDGINDAPALKAADVGISVDSAVDIAKESSDIILMEQNLLVLESGVMEGRRVFGNIIKYIKMAASSSFGNMFSIIGASAILPFIPMLPLQVLINNLLYDFSQIPIPTDEVDAEWLEKPRKWAIGELRRFIFYIGPISSIFDYTTFFIMLYIFNCWNNPGLFHTGWFVESLFTQTLIIHVIRTNKIPFFQSRASVPLILTSIIIVLVGAWLPFSPFASTLGFVQLPPVYWLFLLGMMVCYIVLTQIVKMWFVKKFGEM